MKHVLLFIIALYQKLFSPDHSWVARFFPYGYCRFYPTCSEYTKDAIKACGALRGSARGAWRIVRCNPWNAGGIDRRETPSPKLQITK